MSITFVNKERFVQVEVGVFASICTLLEKCKQDHYKERSGLSSCPKSSLDSNGNPPKRFDGTVIYVGPCDCGADELNAEIDNAIREIKASAGI